jgi:hypothetical protein
MLDAKGLKAKQVYRPLKVHRRYKTVDPKGYEEERKLKCPLVKDRHGSC